MQRTARFNALTIPDWRTFFSKLIQITVGTLIGAVSVVLFFAPGNIASAGLSGLGIILDALLGIPIGVVTFFGNLPIMYLAYRMLGGWKAVMWMFYVSVLFSVAVEILMPLVPPGGLSDEVLLNAIFAGVVGGVGSGLILRGGGTFGGSSTIARILQYRYGVPLGTTYLYANLLIVALAGIFLGWESALLSLLALAIEGAMSDYILEGPSVVRTATIITNQPEAVAESIMSVLRLGVTGWEATGMYTGQGRHVLFVTISRSKVGELRDIVVEADPTAFIVIGQGHTAYGAGFKQPKPKS